MPSERGRCQTFPGCFRRDTLRTRMWLVEPAALWRPPSIPGVLCAGSAFSTSRPTPAFIWLPCAPFQRRAENGRDVVVAETEAGQTSAALPSLNILSQGCSYPKVTVFWGSHVRHEWPFNGLLLNSWPSPRRQQTAAALMGAITPSGINLPAYKFGAAGVGLCC